MMWISKFNDGLANLHAVRLAFQRRSSKSSAAKLGIPVKIQHHHVMQVVIQ